MVSSRVRVIVSILFAILGALLLQGCGTVPSSPESYVEDQELARKLRSALDDRYPLSFRTIHRCLLDVGGRKFVLDGYLAISRPDNFRLIAKGDMGGTVFELSGASGQEVAIRQNAVGLRESWLLKGAARDLAVLYFRRPGPGARLVRREPNLLALVQDLPTGRREEFLFDRESYRLESYRVSQGRRCRYRADFVYSGGFPHWPHETPKTITVLDHDLKYELSISVIDQVSTDAAGLQKK